MKSKTAQASTLVMIIIVLASGIVLGALVYKMIAEGRAKTGLEACRFSIIAAARGKELAAGKQITSIKCDLRKVVFEDESNEEISQIIAKHIDDCIYISSEGTVDWTESPWFAQKAGVTHCIMCSSFEFTENSRGYYPYYFDNYMTKNKFPRREEIISQYITDTNNAAINNEAELFININYNEPMTTSKKYYVMYKTINIPYFQKKLEDLGFEGDTLKTKDLYPIFPLAAFIADLAGIDVIATTNLKSIIVQNTIEFLPEDQAFQTCDIKLN